MIAFDPVSALPSKWSLKPEDTYGLVFWTRDATNLVVAADQLRAYPLVVHYTLTGWHEVEKGSPSLQKALDTMSATVDAFGPEKVVWRFSPVPIVEDILPRFERIASAVRAMGIREVYLSFLQENDLVPETRSARIRRELLKQMAARTFLQIQLCAEDSTLTGPVGQQGKTNLGRGICESGQRFGHDPSPTEGCGCALAVDPFTINESCTFGCAYCYAADKTLTPKKRNTTKHLRVLK